MPQITVRRRIRPTRLALMIVRGNQRDLQKAIQLNTLLWGGRYNAIIPLYQRTPAPWIRDTPPSKVFVRGYLDAFEPDFVVCGDGVDPAKHGIDSAHALKLDDVLTRERLAECGLPVSHVYQWRYDEELQFVQRVPAPVIAASPPRRAFASFIAACFGDFPAGDLAYVGNDFSFLGGTKTQITPSNFLDVMWESHTPLSLGSAGIRTRGRAGPRLAVFLMRASSADDVVDFWNLRALGWNVVPVPTDWSASLADGVRAMIDAQCRPSAALNALTTRAVFLAGRSVSSDLLAEFHERVHPGPGFSVMHSSRPRIWAPEVRASDQTRRVELSAGEDEVEAAVREDSISFSTTGPRFASEWSMLEPEYANVIELRSYDAPDLAGIVPKGIQDLDRLLGLFSPGNRVRVSSEGIAVLTNRSSGAVYWRLPRGLAVFEKWMAGKGRLQLSSAGKIAERLIQIIGGPDRASLVNAVGLIRLFAAASRSASRDISSEELRSELSKLHSKDLSTVDRWVPGLVRQHVLRLGLRISCRRCGQANWYSIEDLRERLSCQRCLETFSFPTDKPPRQPCWAYRPLGPFSVEGHAHGAFAVAAAIRALRAIGMMPRTTWIPSFTLTLPDGKDMEADFGMFWEAAGPDPREPQLIFGECKTFDEFAAKDVHRMRRLAAEFPRAVLVFATFNATLTAAEKRLLAPFARSGRRGWKRPVMVLTSRELASKGSHPFNEWSDGTEAEKKIHERIRGLRTSLRRLCDATQQLRLDLDPDTGWPHYDAP